MDTAHAAPQTPADSESEAEARADWDIPPILRTQRTLQVVLGLLWILDAALQFQPFMFGQGFVNSFILPNATGQPFVIGDLITHIGHFLSPDIAVWNTFFALIQLAIGIGLLFRRTAKPALAVSFVWVLGVWLIGEGLGMLLTGTASALTGAPGSVLIYGLLGLMAWPRPPRRYAPDWSDRPTGIATSAAAQGIGRSITPLVVWSGYWSLAAVLFLLPDNRTITSVQSAIVGMADGQPGWYAHFLTDLGNLFSTSGTLTAWILALLSVIIGLGPLIARRPGVFLALGAVFSLALWIAGQGLVGNLFTGNDTDPNTGPIIIVLALAMTPTVIASKAEWRSPAGDILRRIPAVGVLGLAGLGAALAIAASYPVAPAESTSAAMGGMVMGGSASGAGGSGPAASSNESVTTATCRPHQNGLQISGLDLANSPLMVMGTSPGASMNMNGADASAAAGFNTTKPNWHYTGPAIPQAEAQQLLNEGNNGPSDIRMAVSGCAARLTSGEDIAAQQYVQQTSAAVAQYANPFEAVAAGYVVASPTDYPVAYYVNPQIVAANAAARRTLDPQHVDGLVYAATPSGQQVLAGAFYVLPASETSVPMPYGALVQWHRRTQVCGSGTVDPAMPLAITGYPPCAAGSVLAPTPYLSMVWQVPVAGGPLAIQPPDIQIVEAAVMESMGQRNVG
ncbi:MAG TPA: hypothetical protein VG244_06865 [Acidimicrobiales bacterium]|nr:hypothetical protein [Acidimicrobiales bacterium]